MPDLPTEERICPSKNGGERKSQGMEKQKSPKLLGISCVPLIRGMNHSPIQRDLRWSSTLLLKRKFLFCFFHTK